LDLRGLLLELGCESLCLLFELGCESLYLFLLLRDHPSSKRCPYRCALESLYLFLLLRDRCFQLLNFVFELCLVVGVRGSLL
jgi:hypothetical protein